MTHDSDPALLVLHGVRILGFAGADRVAARFGLGDHDVSEQLLDDQARGWVTWSSFGDDGGWALTEAGRRQNEGMLADELDEADARSEVRHAHGVFVPFNDAVSRACTAWQLAHDPASAGATIAGLQPAADGLASIEQRLVTRLARFAGYHARFASALDQAQSDPGWITGVDRDSAHRVWFELHEDLIATLGLRR
jgi:hypothetical protein